MSSSCLLPSSYLVLSCHLIYLTPDFFCLERLLRRPFFSSLLWAVNYLILAVAHPFAKSRLRGVQFRYIFISCYAGADSSPSVRSCVSFDFTFAQRRYTGSQRSQLLCPSLGGRSLAGLSEFTFTDSPLLCLTALLSTFLLSLWKEA